MAAVAEAVLVHAATSSEPSSSSSVFARSFALKVGATVQALVASPCSPLLVSAEQNFYDALDHRTVRVWDLARRSCVHQCRGRKDWYSFECLALDVTGRRLAAGSWDRFVNVWDLDTGARLHQLEEDDPEMLWVKDVAWDASNTLIASASDDGDVRVWDAATGTLRRRLVGHTGPVHALVAHPSDDLLASGSEDSTVRVWRWSTGEFLRMLVGPKDSVRVLAASDRFVAAATVNDHVWVCSWTTGLCVRVFRCAAHAWSTSCHWKKALAWRDSTLVMEGCEKCASYDGDDGDGNDGDGDDDDGDGDDDDGDGDDDDDDYHRPYISPYKTYTPSHEHVLRVWDTSSEDPREWTFVGSFHCMTNTERSVVVLGHMRVACASGESIEVWETETGPDRGSTVDATTPAAVIDDAP